MKSCCFSGLNLRVATLKNVNMQNCDLRMSVLAGADLEFCNLSGSDLHEANLRGANLKVRYENCVIVSGFIFVILVILSTPKTSLFGLH